MNAWKNFPQNKSPSYRGMDPLSELYEIERLVRDSHKSPLSLGDKQHIYDYIREKISSQKIQEIVSLIVGAILSKKENQELRRENISLQEEKMKLFSETEALKKEITVFEGYNKGILEVDLQGNILSANDLMVKYSGFSQEELMGKSTKTFSSGKHPKEFWDNFYDTILSGRVWTGDICNRRKDGSFVWLWTLVIPKTDKDGNITSFKVIRQDVSESYALKEKLQEVIDQKIDFLTKLPNRTKCLEDFKTEKNRSVAIVHINNIFDINSVFGRERGDKIIGRIGKILRRFSLENNTKIYKFEGTDFCIVSEGEIDERFIIEQYNKLNDIEVFDKEKRIHLSFSLGIALNESNMESLIDHGFLALKEARKTKKSTVFDRESHTTKSFEDFFEMRHLINEAFKEDLFTVFFQEIKENHRSIKRSENRKFECLVRMYDSKEKTNLLSPGKFLPAIKKDGKDSLLTTCITKKVCEFMTKNNGYFSINLTEEDLKMEDFAQNISTMIHTYSSHENVFPVTTDRITFEILEEIENMDSPNILKNIQMLKVLGFKIAIDDFGSGYSNFSRILDFIPDYIKIDMSYVRGIDKNPKHQSLIRAIVGLAHDNRMAIIAEGVETENEQLVLESLGVDFSQGYLFGKPSPSIEKPNHSDS